MGWLGMGWLRTLLAFETLPIAAVGATLLMWPKLHRAGMRNMAATLVMLIAILPGVLLAMEHGLMSRFDLVGRRGYEIENLHFAALGLLGLFTGPLLFRSSRRIVPVERRSRSLQLLARLYGAAWWATGLHSFMIGMAV